MLTQKMLLLLHVSQASHGLKLVAHFLIDHLDLEFVGAVVDNRLPVITLINDGEPLPVIRAYAGKPHAQSKDAIKSFC